MSDMLQSTKTGKNDRDDSAYDLVMKHSATRRYDFQYSNHQGVEKSRNVMKLRIGYDGHNKPWYLKTPKWHEESRYSTHPSEKREYQPVSLYDLQRAIDLGRIDTSKPIDLNVLQNAHVTRLATQGPKAFAQYGVNLVEQGADSFKTSGVHIEVQMADDLAIAAVEAAGSTIECAFYDLVSKQALVDPVSYFMKGKPIDKRQLPLQDLFHYYSNPEKRGYLADPETVQQARQQSIQAFNRDQTLKQAHPSKHPCQIFYNLWPGMLVNLADKTVHVPADDEVKGYYLDEEYYQKGISKAKKKKSSFRPFVSAKTRSNMSQEEWNKWYHGMDAKEKKK